MDYLKKENVDFIKPDMRPQGPNSPDLNPVDYYAVWTALQQRVLRVYQVYQEENSARWKN